MVGTIELAGREMSRVRLVRLKLIYLVGATVGGVALGAGASIVGAATAASFAGPMILALAVSVALSLTMLDGVTVRVPAPHAFRRQVRQRKFWTHGKERCVAEWGLELGLGFATRVPGWGFWSAVGLAALSGNLEQALAIGALFGFVRGIQLFLEPRQLNSGVAPRALLGQRMSSAESRIHASSGLAVVAMVQLAADYWRLVL